MKKDWNFPIFFLLFEENFSKRGYKQIEIGVYANSTQKQKSPNGQKETNMKKSFKLWLPLLLSCVLLSMSIVPAYADSQPTPRYTNTIGCNMAFVVNANGANFSVSYQAVAATFLQAKLTVKLEKKVLGLFWTEVGDTWSSDYCYDAVGHIADTIPADGKGTYRATFKLTVYGNQGIADVIDNTIEAKYS